MCSNNSTAPSKTFNSIIEAGIALPRSFSEQPRHCHQDHHHHRHHLVIMIIITIVIAIMITAQALDTGQLERRIEGWKRPDRQSVLLGTQGKSTLDEDDGDDGVDGDDGDGDDESARPGAHQKIPHSLLRPYISPS